MSKRTRKDSDNDCVDCVGKFSRSIGGGFEEPEVLKGGYKRDGMTKFQLITMKIAENVLTSTECALGDPEYDTLCLERTSP